MSFLLPVIGTLASSLLGSGSGNTTSTTGDTSLSYTTPPTVTQTFDWTSSAPQWKAIGITLLVLLLLGAFDETRLLAIGLAIFIGVLLVLGKYH